MSTTERQPAKTEAERAAHYDAHRHEVEAWAEVPLPTDARSPKQRGVVMSVRFTMDEADAIEQAAQARYLTVSGYLRSVALEAAGAAPPSIDPSRIADGLQSIVDELRAGVKHLGRRNARSGVSAVKATKAGGKVLRDGRTVKVAKTTAGKVLREERTSTAGKKSQ